MTVDRFSIVAVAVALAVLAALLYFGGVLGGGALDSSVLGGRDGYNGDGGAQSNSPPMQVCTLKLSDGVTDMLSPDGQRYIYECPIPEPTAIPEFNPTNEWCDSNDPSGVSYACACDQGRAGDPTCKNLPGSGALCGPQSGACLAPEPEPTYGTPLSALTPMEDITVSSASTPIQGISSAKADMDSIFITRISCPNSGGSARP